MNCPVCNKLLPDGSAFCDGCGANLSQAAAATVICPKCNFSTPANVPYCQNCGAPVSEGRSKGAGSFFAKLKQIPKKFLVIGAAAVALILVVAILLPIVLGALSTPVNKSIAYVKDGEMFYLNKANGKPVQVTTELFDDFEHDEIASVVSSLRNYVITTPDGNRMIFIDKIDNNEDSFNVYYKNPKKEKQEPVKIDSDIEFMLLNEKGNRMIYVKDDKIYEYDFKDKTKIADDVVDYYITRDTKTVLYETDEDGIFLKKSGKDEIEITDDETASISFVTEDLKTVYFYDEDEDLFRYNEGDKKPLKIDSEMIDRSYDENGDIYYVNEDNELMFRGVKSDKSEKIDTDVKSIGTVYEGGKFYYTKGVDSEEGIAQYINDDMKETDEAMVEPEYPDSDDFYPEYPDSDDFDYPEYPYRSDYDTYEEYEAAYDAYRAEYDRVDALYEAAVDEYYEKRDEAEELYDAALDKYYEDRDAWYEKESRDTLRENMKDYDFSMSTSTYFFYNGKKSVEVCQNVGSTVDCAYDAIVRAYNVYGDVNVKIKLSEISYLYEAEQMIEEKLLENATVKIFVEDKVLDFNVEEYLDLSISDDGTMLYYMAEYDEDDESGELYKASISASKLGKAEKIADDVYDYFFMNGDAHYFCDVDLEDEEGTYYVNGKKVLEDVYVDYYGADEDLNTTYVRTDYDDGKYTLYVCENGKASKVGEDVERYSVAGNGDIYYLTDISEKNYKGDLYVYTGGKEAKKIDEDVYGIIRFYTTAEYAERYFED